MKDINFSKCHQKKNKKCPHCDNIIWQSSKACRTCARKIDMASRGSDYKEKMSKVMKGKNTWMKGRKLPKEWRYNIKAVVTGRYKDTVGYTGIHMWVYSKLGKATKCEVCGEANRKRYNWANKDHHYKRDVNDWIQLCVPCHSIYDNKLRKEKLWQKTII